MTDWMWFAAGMATVVAALMLAALVSRWLSRQHPTHRAGIGEDEDDPEPPLRIDPSLYPRGHRPPDVGFGDGTPSAEYEPPPMSLGPPPTYPETPEEHTP
jgi:hypothetical protein